MVGNCCIQHLWWTHSIGHLTLYNWNSLDQWHNDISIIYTLDILYIQVSGSWIFYQNKQVLSIRQHLLVLVKDSRTTDYLDSAFGTHLDTLWIFLLCLSCKKLIFRIERASICLVSRFKKHWLMYNVSGTYFDQFLLCLLCWFVWHVNNFQHEWVDDWVDYCHVCCSIWFQ
jgi:hypothetical protein